MTSAMKTVLAGCLCGALMALPGSGLAALLQMSVSGHRISAEGSSLAMTGSGRLVIDGHEVLIFRTKIVVNGQAQAVAEGAEIRIAVDQGALAIIVDGQPLPGNADR